MIDEIWVFECRGKLLEKTIATNHPMCQALGELLAGFSAPEGKPVKFVRADSLPQMQKLEVKGDVNAN